MKLYKPPQWLLKYLGQEDRLTIQCANFLRLNKLTFHHTFNEGKRTRTQQHKIKGFGVMAGIPDILIFKPCGGFCGLAIELKVIYANGRKNVLSADQKAAAKTMQAAGWKVVTVYDFEQFTEAVKNYMKKNTV